MMKKIWHHYLKWEDYQGGMWRLVSGKDREKYLDQAIEFTGDATKYGSFMSRVLTEWHGLATLLFV
jgi:hypothetical protein